MSEHIGHHEIVRPVREIVHQLGNWVLDKVLPVDVISEVFNGVQQESAERTTQVFGQLSFDSEGNWHNPDGDYIGSPVPDIQGRDL